MIASPWRGAPYNIGLWIPRPISVALPVEMSLKGGHKRPKRIAFLKSALHRSADIGQRALQVSSVHSHDRRGHQPVAPAHDRRHDDPQVGARGLQQGYIRTVKDFAAFTLRRYDITEHTVFIHEPRKLPVVLSPEEVARQGNPPPSNWSCLAPPESFWIARCKVQSEATLRHAEKRESKEIKWLEEEGGKASVSASFSLRPVNSKFVQLPRPSLILRARVSGSMPGARAKRRRVSPPTGW